MTPPPAHPAYAEIGRIDPHGQGLACDTIRPGVAIALAPERMVA